MGLSLLIGDAPQQGCLTEEKLRLLSQFLELLHEYGFLDLRLLESLAVFIVPAVSWRSPFEQLDLGANRSQHGPQFTDAVLATHRPYRN